MIDDKRLAEIKARYEAATPPPWLSNPDGHVYGPQKHKTTVAARYGTFREADGFFIAHARDDVPDLVAEVERLKAELAKAREREIACQESVINVGIVAVEFGKVLMRMGVPGLDIKLMGLEQRLNRAREYRNSLIESQVTLT